MNGIEKITEKILSDGQAEAAAILADAKKEADSIVASYQAEAAEKKQKLAELAEVQAAEQERRIISSAELDARKTILARKQALIAKAFDATKKKITTMDEPSYIDFLCTLAAQSVLDGKEEVVLSAEDSQKFGQKVVDGANKILRCLSDMSSSPCFPCHKRSIPVFPFQYRLHSVQPAQTLEHL